MAGHSRFFICHYIAFGLAAAIITAGAAWYPTHMGRVFGWSASQIGLSLGLTLVIAGTVSQVLAGRVVDSLFKRGRRDAQFRFAAMALLIALPIGVLALTSSNPWIFLGGIGLFLVLLSGTPACATASLNLVTPNELRGAGFAFYAGTSGLLAAAVAPTLVALFAKFFSGPAAIGHGMAMLIGLGCPIAILCFFLGLQAMCGAVEESERWQA
jgi:MFS family permease